MVEYVKEFEQFILSENKEESIMTMIPGSVADQFLHISQKLNKINQEFPESIHNEIEKIKKLDLDGYMCLKIHSILKEYDLPSTSEERKIQLIEMIKKKILNNQLNFDYNRPFTANQNVDCNLIEENYQSQQIKIEDKLDEKIIDPIEIIKKFNEDENEEFYEKLSTHALFQIFNSKFISEEKIDFLLKKSIDNLFLLRNSENFIDYVVKYINWNPEKLDSFDITVKLMSLNEIEQLLTILDPKNYKKLDFNILYLGIINRKFESRLKKTNNLSEEREILTQIYEYIKNKSATKNNVLIQDILLQLLDNGVSLNIYDFHLFIEYLKLPSVHDYEVYNVKKELHKDFYKQIRREFCNYQSKTCPTINNIVSTYLQHFFLHEKRTVIEFSEYLKNDFVNKEYQKALIFRGEENEEVIKLLFGNNYYENILRKVEISICNHNKRKFDVTETVKIEVDLKNVQTLFVKIFEINTENYYYTKSCEISSSISLEGLIATHEESWSFNDRPQIKMRKLFELDKIPLRRGFFIVEFIGGGYASRAVIKKGFLSIISRNTNLGKMIFILNENSVICNTHEKTGIWFEKKFYIPNESGAILIPYMKSNISAKAILVHENFAEITDLSIPEEIYSLKGAFIFNHESLIMGNTAKILFRPFLNVNDKKTAVENMENCKINLLITKTEGESNIPISISFEKLTINRKEEIEIEFQVPPKLVSLNLVFDCEFKNHSKETKQKLSFSKTYNMSTSLDENSVVKIFIKQDVNRNFIAYVLGRNAEPKSNLILNLSINHPSFRDPINTQLKTNNEGIVFLGTLNGVKYINFSYDADSINYNSKFNVPSASLFSYPSSIEMLENEALRLPYNKTTIDKANIQLLQNDGYYELFNDKISLIQNDDSHYSIEIKDLAEGKYLLVIKDMKNIYIIVHKGKYWNDQKNFILKDDMIVESFTNKTPISIEKLEIIENKEDPTKSSIKLKIYNNSFSSRINLNLYQFLSNYSHYAFRDIRNSVLKDEESIVHKFKKWENDYIVNKELNDEIQYVFDRKQLDRYMGNTLEKPSLVMKRQFVRDTTVEIQEVKQGTEFKKMERKVKMRKEARLEQDSYSGRCDSDRQNEGYNDIYLEDSEMKEMNKCQDELNLSGYHNWLVNSPITLNNLKPDENGDLLVENINLNNYAVLHIVCIDENSISEEIVPLSSKKIEKRDITLAETLEVNKFFAEIRKIDNVLKTQNYLIKDIISTKLKIIDSLEKVVSFQLLLNPSLNQLWSEFSFLLKFNELNEEEKKKKISSYFSHELNIFLFFRFPEYFRELVRPILKYKIEKTFIDYFLLNEENLMIEYSHSHKLSTLNAFEKCLLILAIRDKKPELAKSISNSIYFDGLERKPNPITFNRFFNLLMNLKTNDINENEENITREAYKIMDQSNLEKYRCAKPMMYKMACAAPKMMNNQNECLSLIQRDVFEKANFIVEEIENMNMKNNLYKDQGKSKEFRETHYYSSPYSPQSLVINNLLWSDLAKLWEKGNNEAFLSKNILLPCSNVTELICLLSVLSLPISSVNHQYNRKEGSALEIVNNSNLIIFTNEISETTSNIKKDLMIAQHISKFQNLGEEKITVRDFLINEYYRHETIVTNISSKKINFELLIQIPKGAVPIKGSDYTKIKNITLEKFNTISIETIFYFPNPGKFQQFPPNASVDGIVFAIGEMLDYEVKEKNEIKAENQTLDDILLNGTKKSIIEFLSGLKTIKNDDISKIYWMMKDSECFKSIISILRSKGIYDTVIWSFGFYHNNEAVIKEYLENDKTFRSIVGPLYKSSLIEIDDSNNYNINNHFDYHPIINARAHLLDKKTSILNVEFKSTYQKFIISLLFKKTFSNKEILRLSYYLILQDRIDEALKIFKKIDKDQSDFPNIEIQYHYISAYLDFYIGYPEFNLAKEICKKYKNLPLSHWNELFEEIEDQLVEYGGGEIYDDADKFIDEDKKQKQLTKEVIATEPKLTFSIVNKTLQIVYSNIKSINIKYYFIDLEILFSRRPFLKQESDDFSFVVPNFVKEIKLNSSTKEEILIFPISEEFITRNLFIEVSSISKKNFETYFSTSLKILITENLGEVKVTDEALRPLNKVYVKCFAKMKDESIKFYKDGYTDLRGRFNYISLNTDVLNQICKFAIFIMDDNYGSMIKECNPPANIGPSSEGQNIGYDDIQNYRQEIKTSMKLAHQQKK